MSGEVTDVVADLQAAFLAATAHIAAGLPQLPSRLQPAIEASCVLWAIPGLLPETPLTCAGRVQIKTPWFDVYKQELFRMLMFGDHETFDYPVACEPCFGT